jgi:NodT family efflux transporter outer membrane factor (OMF) lipoprotein
MLVRSLPLLALVTLLGGCTVGPDFARPTAPLATSYVAAGPSAIGGPVIVQGEGPQARWWQGFGSPDLDALVDRALTNNLTLAASNATLERARERITAVAGRRLPQVDANARIEHEQVNLAAFGFDPATFGAGGNPEFNLYTVGGGVSFDLDLFGRTRRQIEQVTAEAQAQQRQGEAAHLTVAGRVVNQVLTIAAIRDQIAATNALLQEDQRNVDLTRKRQVGGEGTLVEVLTAQSQLATDRGDLPQLNQQLAEARHMLALLIGIAPSELGATDFSLAQFALPAQVPVTLPSELVHKRPDILQAEARLHAATAAIGVATANLYPDLTLGTTPGPVGAPCGRPAAGRVPGLRHLCRPDRPGLPRGHVEGPAARRPGRGPRRRRPLGQQTVLEAFGQVADLLEALHNDTQSASDQREAVEVATRSLQLSRRSFEVGNSGVLQVLDSSRTYQRARLALVQAQRRQYLNVARLYVATAGGWTGPAV